MPSFYYLWETSLLILGTSSLGLDTLSYEFLYYLVLQLDSPLESKLNMVCFNYFLLINDLDTRYPAIKFTTSKSIRDFKPLFSFDLNI